MKKQDNVIIGIYKITNIMGEVYVGQSTNVWKRYDTYRILSCKQQPKIYNSLKKHGWENHKFEIIEECLVEQLNEREIYWGLLYNTLGWGGLNCKLGGSKGLCSEETKQKISNSPNRIENIRKSKLGKPFPSARITNLGNTYRKGIMHTVESKEKISKANSGRKHSEEKRKNMGAPKGGKHSDKAIQQKIKSLSKCIIQYDLSGSFVREWDSIKQAKSETKITNISANLLGKVKRAGNYIWKYKEN